jgi:hypothetical protein
MNTEDFITLLNSLLCFAWGLLAGYWWITALDLEAENRELRRRLYSKNEH